MRYYDPDDNDVHVNEVQTSATANPFDPNSEDESQKWMAAQWELNRQVENVKWKEELEDRALDAFAADTLFGVAMMEIDSRVAARREAAELLDRLRNEWPRRRVVLRHGAVRIDPPAPAILAGSVERLEPYLCDLLEGEEDARRATKVGARRKG